MSTHICLAVHVCTCRSTMLASSVPPSPLMRLVWRSSSSRRCGRGVRNSSSRSNFSACSNSSDKHAAVPEVHLQLQLPSTSNLPAYKRNYTCTGQSFALNQHLQCT